MRRLPEFVAEEEMSRHRGYWISPDGGSVLIQRTDVAHLERLHISAKFEMSGSEDDDTRTFDMSTASSADRYKLDNGGAASVAALRGTKKVPCFTNDLSITWVNARPSTHT